MYNKRIIEKVFSILLGLCDCSSNSSNISNSISSSSSKDDAGTRPEQ